MSNSKGSRIATQARLYRRARARSLDSGSRLEQLQVMYPSRLAGGGPGPAAGYLLDRKPLSGRSIATLQPGTHALTAHQSLCPKDRAAVAAGAVWVRSERMVIL